MGLFNALLNPQPIDSEDKKYDQVMNFTDIATQNRYSMSLKNWDSQMVGRPTKIPQSNLWIVYGTIYPTRRMAEIAAGLRPIDVKAEPITDILPLEEQLKNVEIDRIRPACWDEFVGQTEVKERLRDTINASLLTGQSLEHMLFIGNKGLGKTSLACLVAKELRTDVTIVTGNSIKDVHTLYHIFKKLTPTREGKGSILFIDEAHALKKTLLDGDMLKALEDYSLYMRDGTSEVREIKLPKFCLIASTTRVGDLPEPFVSRMRVYKLQNYTEKEIAKIIDNLQVKLCISINPDARDFLSSRVRFNPRLAVDIVKEARELMITSSKNTIDLDIVRELCRRRKVYRLGLTQDDIKILRALVQNESLSARSLATLINESQKNYEAYYEGFLFKNGLLDKSVRGRTISQAGIRYLKEMDEYER